MNPDLALAVFLSSGAGWYAGHYFERKKARAAFGQLVSQCTFATTLANVAIGMIVKARPDSKPDELIKELLDTCKGAGMNAVALTTEQARAAGVISGSNDKTE